MEEGGFEPHPSDSSQRTAQLVPSTGRLPHKILTEQSQGHFCFSIGTTAGVTRFNFLKFEGEHRVPTCPLCSYTIWNVPDVKTSVTFAVLFRLFLLPLIRLTRSPGNKNETVCIFKQITAFLGACTRDTRGVFLSTT